MDVSTTPSSNTQQYIKFIDKNGKDVGMLKTTHNTANYHKVEITAIAQKSDGSNLYGALMVYVKSDGTTKTDCPTPASNSNDTSIATTAWVKSKMLDFIYPIGSIYMSVNNVSPQTFLGGTWVALQDRFLIGAGHSYAVNATGGATTHTLSVNEMPSHSHTFAGSSIGSHTHTYTYFKLKDPRFSHGSFTGAEDTERMDQTSTTSNSGASGVSGSIAASGGNQAHSIMNPYLAVYMWKRTA